MAEASEGGLSQLRLQMLLSRLFADVTNSMRLALVEIGLREGIFGAVDGGASDACELEIATGLERYFLELWLELMIDAGYITGPRESASLSPEQKEILVEHGGDLAGGVSLAAGLCGSTVEIRSWARDGVSPPVNSLVSEGLTKLSRAKISRWGEQWLEMAPTVARRLEEGCTCVDLGTGSGSLVAFLRKRFGASRIVGSDPSFETLLAGRRSGVFCGDDRSTRDVDVFVSFESLHHMAEGGAVIERIADRLRSRQGVWLVIEPLVPDSGPIRNYLLALSALFCLPDSSGNGLGVGAIVDRSALIGRFEEFGLEVLDEGDTEQHFTLTFGLT